MPNMLQANILIFISIGLLAFLYGLFQQSFIKRLQLQDSISRLKSVRLYIVLLITFDAFLITTWYVNTYVTHLTYLMFPFTLLLLTISIIFGMRIGLASFVLTAPFIIFFLIYPYGFSQAELFSEQSITTYLSLLSGVLTGTSIRAYHRLLGNRVDELQNLYWQTRSKLALTTGEQEILQAIDKASLAVASVEKQSLDNTLAIIANEVKQLLGVFHIGIGLMQDGQFVPHVVIQDPKLLQNNTQNTILYDIISRILSTNRINPIVVDIKRASQLVGTKKMVFLFDKILVAPIFANNNLLGGIFVTNHKEKITFSANDIKKISLFAAHGALAISNAARHEELEMLIKMRDQFASVASHELKTPLSAIKLYTQLLQNKLSSITDVYIEKALSTINQEANKLTTLINTLLDFSRLQTGKFELDKQRFSLVEICKHNIAVMQVIYPNHRFEFHSSVQSAPVVADRIRLEQVITNLLGNAARYSEPGTTITLSIKKSPDRYVISVNDRGIGMDQQEKAHIFEPFFQTEHSMKSKKAIQGMGLGLYISSEIVKKHRGRLWVESEKGVGSTFYVSLPTKLYRPHGAESF